MPGVYDAKSGSYVQHLVKTAIQVQHERDILYNMMDDAPPTDIFTGLVSLTTNRKNWKKLHNQL